jgi:hypothetical protein
VFVAKTTRARDQAWRQENLSTTPPTSCVLALSGAMTECARTRPQLERRTVWAAGGLGRALEELQEFRAKLEPAASSLQADADAKTDSRPNRSLEPANKALVL